MSVRVFAPAKINLTLEVGYPYRATGRHPLQSVVAFAEIGDWVSVAENSTDVTLHIEGPFSEALVKQSGNIVLEAVGALADFTETWGGDLTLVKNLPIASGMGGGSADAAATLKALNEWWLVNLSEAELMEVGRKLGGDVPVCVYGRSAYMTGEGEKVAPLALPMLDAVLINPGVAVSTAEVFTTFDAMAGGAAFVERAAPVWSNLDDVVTGIAERGNMLAAAARVIEPAIDMVWAALSADKRALCVSLSGSGATVFALAANAELAHALASDLSRSHPDWWIAPTRLGALDAMSADR